MDSKQEIMEATYSALCSHGYAELTIENIAEESEKGKSLIYYHFDDKEDLMLSFLDHMYSQIEKDLNNLDGGPEKRLDGLLELLLGVEDEEMWKFHKAFSELKAQASYNPNFQEKFIEFYKLLINSTEDILTELEIEEAELNAKLLISTVDGTVNQQIILEEEKSAEDMKEKLKEIANCV